MPKKISSLPTGAINRTDNLITASDGSDELKRNTVDELLAEPNADISALQTENAELKAQITEMEEQISELNSNLSDYIIHEQKTLDVSITISAYSGIQVSAYMGYPSTPSGYTELFHAARCQGSAQVVNTGINSDWITNTSSSSQTINQLIYDFYFVRNI